MVDQKQENADIQTEDIKLDRHRQLLEKEKEIKNRIQKQKARATKSEDSELLNYKTYITGLLSGTIKDIDVYDHKIVLSVMTKEGIIRVDVSDDGSYSENNELMRLLKSKNISEGRIGDLMGEEITIKSRTLCKFRDTDIDNLDFSVHIPRGFSVIDSSIFYGSTLFRYLGIMPLSRDLVDPGDKFFFVVEGFLLYIAILIIMNLLISSFLLTFLSTLVLCMSTVLICKLGIEFIVRKAFRYYREDRIKET